MTRLELRNPSLTGGVSQQAPQRRFPSQAESITNAWLSPIRGMGPRGPLRHIKELRSGDPGDLFIHTIDRDPTERYSVHIKDSEIKVYDLFTGDEETVKGPRRNHVEDSTDFSDTTTWPGVNIVRTSGQADPEGGTDAWKLELNIATNVFFSQDCLVPFMEPGEEYVFWSAVQYGNCAASVLQLEDTAGLSDPYTAVKITWNYDGTTGRIAPVISGTGTGVQIGGGDGAHNYGLELLEDNWVYVWISLTYETAMTGITLKVRPSVDTPASGDYIRMWRPMLEHTLTGLPSWCWVDLKAAYAADFSTYLALGGEDPRDVVRATTVGDFTFLLNKEKQVAQSAVKTGPRRYRGEALLFVKQGGSSNDYYVSITSGSAAPVEEFVCTAKDFDGGTQYDHCVHGRGKDATECAASGGIWIQGSASGTTNEDKWVEKSDNANEITHHLSSLINASGAGGWDAVPEGPVIWLRSDEEFDSIIVDDSASGSSFSVIWKTVETLSELPTIAPDGFRVQVVGAADAATTVAGFYVVFEADAGPGAFGPGKWRETTKAGQKNFIDIETMPHTLVRRQDNASGSVTGFANKVYFEFAPFCWSRREVGDDQTNAFPPFISTDPTAPRYLDELSVVESRMMLLSADAVTMSEVNFLENLFRTTTTVVSDSDRIGVTASSAQLALFKHAIPVDERVVLFTDRAQLVMAGNPFFTPSSISISPKLEYPCYSNLEPRSSGRGIFFGFPRGSLASADDVSFSGIREMIPVSDLEFVGSDITDVVPEYIEGRLRKITVAAAEGVLACATGEDSKVYVFKFSHSGTEDTQAAWSVWDFGDTVRDVEFVQSDLVCSVQRSSGVTLEMLTVGDGIVDPDSEFLQRMDRKVDDSELTGGTYDAGANTTTFTLPYTVRTGATMICTTRATPGVEGGVNVPVESATGTTLVLTGDQTSADLWVGELFATTYQFSAPYLQDSEGAVRAGQMLVNTLALSYHDTAAFRVDVAHQYGDTFTEQFDAHQTSTGSGGIGTVVLDSGEMAIAIGNDPDKVDVSVVVEHHLPCNIVSAEWRFNYTRRRGRR